jgi:hypothetical protein
MTPNEKLMAENMEQIDIALHDPDNRYYAWERLGREPTEEELLEQYILMGGSPKYREEHPIDKGE